MMLWGTFLRVTVGLHATWLVNSATHLWGKRRFETKDDSRNNWWVAILTGGEGWHNNHHAHPVSARHGLAWYEFDINYYGIWLMEKMGLAKKVQIAKFDRHKPQTRRRLHGLTPTPAPVKRPPRKGRPSAFKFVIPGGNLRSLSQPHPSHIHPQLLGSARNPNP